MKTTGLIFILFTYFQVFGQEPQTIHLKLKKDDGHGYKYKVDYYALKADTSIKHGVYKRYDILNDLEETGYYNHGIKDSTWKTYLAGKMVNSVGNYKEGKKQGLWNYYTNIPYTNWKPTPYKTGNYLNDSLIGVWTYYLETGEIEQKYDHTLDSLIYRAQDKQKRTLLVKQGSNQVVKLLDLFPVLVGGNVEETENWYKIDQNKLQPLADGKNQTYTLTFWIKSNGEAYGYEMVKGVNSDYDNYVIEFYKNNCKWIPGVINGKNVECQYVVKVIDLTE